MGRVVQTLTYPVRTVVAPMQLLQAKVEGCARDGKLLNWEKSGTRATGRRSQTAEPSAIQKMVETKEKRMDLREFVAETLVQIQMGVQDAISKHGTIPGAAGAINPVWVQDVSAIRAEDVQKAEFAIRAENVQKIEFDVAVTVVDKVGGEGKGGLKVFGVEVGGEASKSSERSTVSRIKFTVPIAPAALIIPSHRSEQPADPRT